MPNGSIGQSAKQEAVIIASPIAGGFESFLKGIPSSISSPSAASMLERGAVTTEKSTVSRASNIAPPEVQGLQNLIKVSISQ
jgi:hypothetical protein